MDLLEEGVLAVGAGLAEDDGAGLAPDRGAVAAHPLAVRFHFELLQEGRQTPQAVGVGGDGARGAVQAVDVVDLGQGQQDRSIGLQRGLEEVPVQFGGAVEKFPEDVPAQANDARQADRRPQGVTAADPVAETEHTTAAEGGCPLRRGSDADEVPVHALGGQGGGQPGLGDLGVGQGLLGGEGLGDDDDQGGLGIQPGQGLGHVARIDIGHEADLDGRVERAQGVPDQARAQVRSADPDMNHGLERPTGRPRLHAGANSVGVVAHLITYSFHLGRYRLAEGEEIGAGGRAQSRMQHGPPLGQVYRLAPEQGGATTLDVGGAGQGQGGFEARAGPALLGQVQMQTCGVDRHPRQAVGIGDELVEDAGVGVAAGDGLQFGPGGVRHPRLPLIRPKKSWYGACKLLFTAQAEKSSINDRVNMGFRAEPDPAASEGIPHVLRNHPRRRPVAQRPVRGRSRRPAAGRRRRPRFGGARAAVRRSGDTFGFAEGRRRRLDRLGRGRRRGLPDRRRLHRLQEPGDRSGRPRPAGPSGAQGTRHRQ